MTCVLLTPGSKGAETYNLEYIVVPLQTLPKHSPVILRDIQFHLLSTETDLSELPHVLELNINQQRNAFDYAPQGRQYHQSIATDPVMNENNVTNQYNYLCIAKTAMYKNATTGYYMSYQLETNLYIPGNTEGSDLMITARMFNFNGKTVPLLPVIQWTFDFE